MRSFIVPDAQPYTLPPLPNPLTLRRIHSTNTSKDTDAGRRQQDREIEFLLHFSETFPDAENIVRVVEARTVPYGMLLMHREPHTLPAMLAEAGGVNVAALTK